jgi:PAS domain S-box-containing protein
MPDLPPEELYREFFEQAPLGCVIARWDGSFILVNKAYAKIHGRTVEDTLKLKYQNFTPKEYLEEDREQIEELDRTGRSGPFNKVYIKKDKKSKVRVRVTLSRMIINEEKYIWAIHEELRDDQGSIQRDPSIIDAEKKLFDVSHVSNEPLEKEKDQSGRQDKPGRSGIGKSPFSEA